MNATKRDNPPGLEQARRPAQKGYHASLCSDLDQALFTGQRTPPCPGGSGVATHQTDARQPSHPRLTWLVTALSHRGAGPAEKPDCNRPAAATTGRAVWVGGTGRPGGALGYLLRGEEEAISGPLSSINSRTESAWSRRRWNQPCFLNTHGWSRPFNPQTPQGSCRKKTVAFGLETLQLGWSLGHFCSAQKQTEDKNIVTKGTVFYNGVFKARESGLVIILYTGDSSLYILKAKSG